MPLVESKLPWRHRLNALPFTDTFEAIAAETVNRDRLLTALGRTAHRPVVVRTEIRLSGWSVRALGTARAVDVSGGAAGVLAAADAKTRRNVKRAQRPGSGLNAQPIVSRDEFMGPHLRLIRATRRRLGAPSQPQRYWDQIWRLHELGHAVTVGVYLEGRLVASGVFLLGVGEAVYKYSASDPSVWRLRPNYLMLASAYDELASRGIRMLSFGVTASSNRSLREFKSRWGGEEHTAYHSSTDPRLLPTSLEPGSLLSRAIRTLPPVASCAIGALAYPLAS